MSARSTAITYLLAACCAFGQSRVSDKDLEALISNLRDDAKSFRPVFDSALHKSTIRKTSREKEAKSLAARFEKQTDAMLKQFKNSKKADTALPLVRSTAQQIETLVANLNLGPKTNSRWSKIQIELQHISDAFGVQNTAAGSCVQTAGPERSRRMVKDCLAVSPATHPPCNAQNSCALIVDEIKRSCSLIGPGSAPAFCSGYR